MALPADYAAILNELNKDVLRARPTDPLQFCASWFNRKLEEQRRVAIGAGVLSSVSAGSASGPPATPDRSAGLSRRIPAPSALKPSGAVGALASEDHLGGMASPTQTGFFNKDPFSAPRAAPVPVPALSAVSSAAGANGASAFPRSRGGSTDSTYDEDGSAAAAAAGAAAAPFLPPPSTYNLGRRTSVSAESMAPSSVGPDGKGTAPLPKTVIPKTPSQMARIQASIGNNLLFRNLEEDQYDDVLLAMKEVKIDSGVAVIEQGAQGDYFYVVEDGTLDVYIRPAGAASSASSDDGRGPSSSLAALGDKKISYGPGASFGELALLYAQPRAATVLSTSACTLWALDRVTFRSILMETNSRRRVMYESFLKEVSLFEHLNDAERAKISDSLEVRSYEIGERVITQGERGTEFFIIVDGAAEVTKERDGKQQTVGRLHKGDYFGELALLNNAPRAASVVASADPSNPSQTKLKVATLSERAFTRLLGPLADIMGRHAAEHYRDAPLASDTPARGSVPLPGPNNSHPSSASASSAAPPAFRTGGHVFQQPTHASPQGPSASLAPDAKPQGSDPMGMWRGGLGASPFGAAH